MSSSHDPSLRSRRGRKVAKDRSCGVIFSSRRSAAQNCRSCAAHEESFRRRKGISRQAHFQAGESSRYKWSGVECLLGRRVSQPMAYGQAGRASRPLALKKCYLRLITPYETTFPCLRRPHSLWLWPETVLGFTCALFRCCLHCLLPHPPLPEAWPRFMLAYYIHAWSGTSAEHMKSRRTVVDYLSGVRDYLWWQCEYEVTIQQLLDGTNMQIKAARITMDDPALERFLRELHSETWCSSLCAMSRYTGNQRHARNSSRTIASPLRCFLQAGSKRKTAHTFPHPALADARQAFSSCSTSAVQKAAPGPIASSLKS